MPGFWLQSLALGIGSVPACKAAEHGGTAIGARPIAPPEAGERIGQLRLLAAYELDGGKSFGGLSSVQLDGSGILFLSDRSRLFRAERVEDPSGRLTALTGWTEPRLPRTLQGADTEALTQLPDGSFVIGAEDRDELYRLPHDLAAATALPLPPFLRKAPPNESIEAVAALPDGSLLAASEGIAAGPGLAMAALISGEGATRVALPAGGGFRPTDATVAGRTLFLLERRLSLLGGLGGRLMAIPLDTIARPPIEAQQNSPDSASAALPKTSKELPHARSSPAATCSTSSATTISGRSCAPFCSSSSGGSPKLAGQG